MEARNGSWKDQGKHRARSLPSTHGEEKMRRRRGKTLSKRGLDGVSLLGNGTRIVLTQGDSAGQLIYTMPLMVGSQELPVQVDTGSSDLWVTSTSCKSGSCKDKSIVKYDESAAGTTNLNTDFNITYFAGGASGGIYSADVTIGDTTIPAQAFSAADSVTDENLDTGGFSGVAGLALPANSIIQRDLNTSTTAGDPNTSNNPSVTGSLLTGLWRGAQTGTRYFGVGLQRTPQEGGKGDSVLTLSAHDPAYAPNISQIQYTSVIPDSDSVHRNWRVYVTDLSVDYNGQRAAIPVGYSSLASSGGYPLAVLDTGGTYNLGPVNVLNALYGVWGIGPGQDGGYYVPCDLEMNITLTVGGVSVPIHPLDASLYQLSGPADDCLGSFQAITAEDPSKLPADFILSAAFLRNVYSVYSCDSVLIDPPPGPAGACKPQVGLLPLTNKTQAADEFHRVRVLKQSLGGGSDAYGDGEASKGGLSDGAKIAIGTIVGVLGGVIILFLLALFLRRKIMSRRPEHDADGDSSSPTGEKDGQAGSAGVAGMSAAQLAKARQLRQLQGIFDDDIDVHDTHLLNHSAAAQDRSLSGAQVQPEWGAGFSPSSPAIGTESTSASGFRYYEADRIKRDYLRRHPSLDRLENEAQSGTLGDDESRSPQPSQCQSRHSESASDSSLVRLVPRTRTSATTTSIAPTASGLNRFSRRTEYESGTGTGTGTELDPIVSRPSTRLFGTPVMNVDLDMDMDGREREEEEPFGDSFGTPLRRLDCS